MFSLTLFADGYKDKLLSEFVSSLISSYFKVNNYGEIKKFVIDTTHKTIYIESKLIGEKDDISIHIKQYEFQKSEKKDPCSQKGTGEFNTYFIAKDVNTSKEWINRMAKNYLKEVKIEVKKSEYFILSLILE
jgi:hypothetical protein